ncbi:MAG: hypothetical protein MI741_16370, partial [Rhodospirillales bacterium]|nr:hypothetical protein [Rhodospirillales bacterium]
MAFSLDVYGFLALMSVLLAAGSVGYLALAFARTLSFLPRHVEANGEMPAVTLFKPVRGTNERLYRNLR